MPDSGHDNMSGKRTYRFLSDEDHAAFLSKLMPPYSEPRTALEIVRADLAGTLKRLAAIVLVFALLIAGAALLEGVRL